MKYIITGVNSGLGRYLHQNIPDSLGITRDNYALISSRIDPSDIIIHCAFNKTNNIKDHLQYLNDNIFLTKKLVDKGNKIIYISSIDVYSQENPYTLFKKFSESIINLNSCNLVLRLPALVGPLMRENHITKMVSNTNNKITLSKESTFNYITYDDVLNFTLDPKNKSLIGTYDFTSQNTINLDSIQKLFNLSVQFGNYTYNTPFNFPNPINKIWNKMNKTSIDSLKETFKIKEI
jgi:hypothetical protein